MSSSLKAAINDIDYQLGIMSMGDFMVTPQAEYIGDYISIKNAIINISTNLSNTLGYID